MIKIHDDRSVRSDRHSLNVAAAVQTAVSPALVILFGSRATGNHTGSSDIDLLLVVDYGNTIAPELMARRAAQDFMAARPPLLDTDIIVFTRREFDRYRLANQHIAGQAANYGVVMNGDVLDEPAENEDGFLTTGPRQGRGWKMSLSTSSISTRWSTKIFRISV